MPTPRLMKNMASLLLLLLICCGPVRSQIFFNGNSKYYLPNHRPLRWWMTNEEYNEALVDSSVLFRGQNTLRVRSIRPAWDHNEMLIWQQVNVSKFPDHHRMRISCYVSFDKGVSEDFWFFVNDNLCDTGWKRPFSDRQYEAVQDGGRKWIKMTLDRDIHPACNEMLIGFQFVHWVDAYMGGWEMWIDGRPVADVPVYAKPLPDARDKQSLLSALTGFGDIGQVGRGDVKTAFMGVVGNSRVVALGEAAPGTKEFARLRQQLTNYLMDSCGFNTIVYGDDSTHGQDLRALPYDEAIAAYNYRDSLMASHILRLLQTDSTRKIILLAHDAHIRKLADSIHPDLQARYIGTYLADSLGSHYKSFALTAGSGTMRSSSTTNGPLRIDSLDRPMADCYEFYFHDTGKPMFFAPLFPGHPAIQECLRLRSVGPQLAPGQDSFRPQALNGNYDGVFYIDRVNWARVATNP